MAHIDAITADRAAISEVAIVATPMVKMIIVVKPDVLRPLICEAVKPLALPCCHCKKSSPGPAAARCGLATIGAGQAGGPPAMTFFVALLSILSAFHFETMEFQTRPPHKLQRLELQNVTQLHHAGLQDEPHKTTVPLNLGGHLPTQAFRHRPKRAQEETAKMVWPALMDRLKQRMPARSVRQITPPCCL